MTIRKFPRLREFATNPATQAEFTEFLRAHTESLKSHHTYTEAKALQAAAEILGVEGAEVTRENSLTCFQLTLANNAGWLLVEVPAGASLYAALKSVQDLVVDMKVVNYGLNDITEAYFLGNPAYRSSLADVVRKLTSSRQLWWIADSQNEAEKWKEELEGKGAISVELKPQSPKLSDGQIDVVFSINPADAAKFFGSEDKIEPETYLDEDLVRL